MALIVSYDDRSYQKKFFPLHGKLWTDTFNICPINSYTVGFREERM